MNLLKSPLRRTTAAVAGALIGLAGAAAFASPASATHPTVSGEAECLANGNWTVTWTVSNEWPNDGVVKEVIVQLPEGGKLVDGGQIFVGAELKHKRHKEVLVSKQEVDAKEPKAKLRVAVLFDNNHREGDDAMVPRPDNCTPPPPTTTPPTTTPPTTTPPTTTPPTTTPPTSPTTTPPSSPAPGEPTPIIEMDCDTMTFGLDNPADGEEVELVMTTSKGETRELTIAPGEKKTEKFSATPGFVLTVKDVASGESVELPYTQPEDCDTAGSGGGDGGELPLTGAAASGIAGGAAALLAIGAGLFVMARRRKVKFTA